MSKLIVFADESGTPVSNQDQYFLTSTISYIDRIPEISMKDGHFQTLLETIKCSGGIPSICYLKSFKGFKDRIEKKIKEINYFSRFSNKLTHNNSKYYSEDGHNPRNWIWIQSMGICVLYSLIQCTFSRTTINEIDIFYDRKSLKDEHQSLFEDWIKRIRKSWIEGLNQQFGKSGKLNTLLMAQESDIHIEMVDIEKKFKPVHQLASICMNKYLKKNKLSDFIDEFRKIGYKKAGGVPKLVEKGRVSQPIKTCLCGLLDEVKLNRILYQFAAGALNFFHCLRSKIQSSPFRTIYRQNAKYHNKSGRFRWKTTNDFCPTSHLPERAL